VSAPKGLGFLLYGEWVERNLKGDLLEFLVGLFSDVGLRGLKGGLSEPGSLASQVGLFDG